MVVQPLVHSGSDDGHVGVRVLHPRDAFGRGQKTEETDVRAQTPNPKPQTPNSYMYYLIAKK